MGDFDVGTEATAVLQHDYPEVITGVIVASGPEYVTILPDEGFRTPVSAKREDALPYKVQCGLRSPLDWADEVTRLIKREKTGNAFLVRAQKFWRAWKDEVPSQRDVDDELLADEFMQVHNEAILFALAELNFSINEAAKHNDSLVQLALTNAYNRVAKLKRSW